MITSLIAACRAVISLLISGLVLAALFLLALFGWWVVIQAMVYLTTP